MNDMVKSCLGVMLVFLSIGIGAFVLLGAGIAAIGLGIGGGDLSSLQVPTFIGIGVAALLFIFAVYLFIRINDYSWLTITIPGVLSGVYAILPDLLTGQPTDDLVALALGAGLSVLLAWRKQQREDNLLEQASKDLLSDRLGN